MPDAPFLISLPPLSPMPGQSIAGHLQRLARTQPDRLALIGDGREISYGRMLRDVRRMVSGIRSYNLPPAALVNISSADFYMHWLAVLGCEALGLVSRSLLSHHSDTRTSPNAFMPRLVLGDTRPPAPSFPFQAISPEWLNSQPIDDHAFPDLPPHTPTRLVTTSGTTGQPKWVMRTRLQQSLWIDSISHRMACSPSGRYLITNDFSIQTQHLIASAFLRSGGLLIHTANVPIQHAIEAYAPSLISLLPAQVSALLDVLPEHARPRDLALHVYGGRIFGTPLLALTRQKLATTVLETYGTNEVGPVAMVRDDGWASPIPGISLRVVDESGKPLPQGHSGHLQIRTPWMTGGYVDHPDADRAMFQDGWFQPGDEAILSTDPHTPNGLVKVIGRSDHLLNIGGVKHDPTFFEERLRRIPGIHDAAVLPLADSAGQNVVGIALVVQEDADITTIPFDLPQDIAAFVRFEVRRVGHIPRTETGKAQRRLLLPVFS